MKLACYLLVIRCWAFIVSVCVGASQRILLSVLARNPKKGPAHEISHEPGSGWRKESPWEYRRSESAEGSRRELSAWYSSPEGGCEKMEAGQRRESTEVRKTTAKHLLTYRGRVNQRGKMSALQVALWEFSLEYTFALAHRMQCHRLLLSSTWS